MAVWAGMAEQAGEGAVSGMTNASPVDPYACWWLTQSQPSGLAGYGGVSGYGRASGDIVSLSLFYTYMKSKSKTGMSNGQATKIRTSQRRILNSTYARFMAKASAVRLGQIRRTPQRRIGTTDIVPGWILYALFAILAHTYQPTKQTVQLAKCGVGWVTCKRRTDSELRSAHCPDPTPPPGTMKRRQYREGPGASGGRFGDQPFVRLVNLLASLRLTSTESASTIANIRYSRRVWVPSLPACFSHYAGTMPVVTLVSWLFPWFPPFAPRGQKSA
ncbi:hypothetical protein F5887DRAFT_927176 [Amanita rubescens]|nr:hypothetical protein F5887DRAFT_927176 [Amanita rubescens]